MASIENCGTLGLASAADVLKVVRIGFLAGAAAAALAAPSHVASANGDWWLPRQAERYLVGKVVSYRGETRTQLRAHDASE